MNAVRTACLIGWPAAHSRSPIIHKYWLKQLGIAGDYRIEAVEPAAFPDFIGSLVAHGYCGANVTIPHKENALAMSQPDARARAVGAANTLYFADGSLHSTNTDVEGFIGNLDASAPGWHAGGEAVVLGAGGSARAVVFGLVERGVARIHLVNRSRDRAQALAQPYGDRVRVVTWDEVGATLPKAELVVNTTSLGMKGQLPLPLDVSVLRADATVADLVYVPLRTDLLEAASARGLRTADGLGMLLHQAVRGFELWFGKWPQVTPELRALVEADLTSA
jgi:shikimate dehydrogenase